MQSTTAIQNAARNSLSDRINADILLSGRHHHQRDLFTGSLSIPTHVGTVIHAFETLARKSSPPPAMQFELQTTGTSKMLHHRKSLSTAAELYHRPQQCAEHCLGGFDVPPAPPPPAMNANLAQRSLSSPSVSEMIVTGNVATATPCEYHARTLSHTHAATEMRQHTPATMIRGAAERFGSRSDADGSSDALKQSHRTFDTRNSATNNNFSGNRNIDAAVSVANISYKIHGDSNGPPLYGPTTKNVLAAIDSDTIDAGDDYRKHIFGSHPAIELQASSAAPAAVTAAEKPKIHYDGARRIPRPVSQTIRNDNNNNAHKSHDIKRPSSQIYLVRSDNCNYLQPSDLAKQFSGYSSTKNNPGAQSDDTNWNLGEDNAFLRGSTVSQSFIKNMKNASSSTVSRNPPQTTSVSKKLSSLVEASTVMPSSRTYYKPQKYILSDGSQDELRVRYTEHSGNCNISRTKSKSPPRIFRPAKFGGFGYTRQKWTRITRRKNQAAYEKLTCQWFDYQIEIKMN